MFRLGDGMSDSREVLVDEPAEAVLADSDVILSSTPKTADVGVTSLPTATTGNESSARPTATRPTTITGQPSKPATSNNRIEVTGVQGRPARTKANVVRRNFTVNRRVAYSCHLSNVKYRDGTLEAPRIETPKASRVWGTGRAYSPPQPIRGFGGAS